mgnify:CR=1 FL=1
MQPSRNFEDLVELVSILRKECPWDRKQTHESIKDNLIEEAYEAIEAIDNLAEKYTKAEKTLHLRHLSKECRLLLEKAGDLVEVNIQEDPNYHIADDKLAS